MSQVMRLCEMRVRRRREANKVASKVKRATRVCEQCCKLNRASNLQEMRSREGREANNVAVDEKPIAANKNPRKLGLRIVEAERRLMSP